MNLNANRFTVLLFACVITLALSGAIGSRAAYLYLKANVAQILLRNAWSNSLAAQHSAKPWSWADIATAAQISYLTNDTEERESLIVLDNASGEAMAFGPGLVAGDLNNAAQTTIALGGHRDTHLAFLEFANPQTRFELQILNGKTFHYQFEDSFVVDSSKQTLQIATEAPGLVLITCYPFNALQSGGPLRLVVRARLTGTDNGITASKQVT